MRRRRGLTSTPSVRPCIEQDTITVEGTNSELWIQLESESRKKSTVMMETIQQLQIEMATLRTENERLVREQEHIIKSLTNKKNHRNSKPSSNNGNRGESHQRKEDSVLKGIQTQESRGGQKTKDSETEVTYDSDERKKKKKRRKVELQGEVKNIQPLSNDGETKEITQSWFKNLTNYFHIYDYDENLKAQLDFYQLWGKDTLWWEEIKVVHVINEKSISWDVFQKYFQNKYLTEQFYDNRAKEFHELRLGQLTIDEYVAKFTIFLRYVPYLQEEKAKVQWFVSSFLTHMKERLEFEYPKTMDDVGRRPKSVTSRCKKRTLI